MLRVHVVYVGRLTGEAKRREESIEVLSGISVYGFLENLAALHGNRFRQMVFANVGLMPGLSVLVNGVNVTGRVCIDDAEKAILSEEEVEQLEVELVLLDSTPGGGY